MSIETTYEPSYETSTILDRAMENLYDAPTIDCVHVEKCEVLNNPMIGIIPGDTYIDVTLSNGLHFYYNVYKDTSSDSVISEDIADEVYDDGELRSFLSNLSVESYT